MEFSVCLENRETLSEPLIRRRLNLKEGESPKASENIAYSKPKNVTSEEQTLKELMNRYQSMPHKEMVLRICNELGISRATFYRKKKTWEPG